MELALIQLKSDCYTAATVETTAAVEGNDGCWCNKHKHRDDIGLCLIFVDYFRHSTQCSEFKRKLPFSWKIFLFMIFLWLRAILIRTLSGKTSIACNIVQWPKRNFLVCAFIFHYLVTFRRYPLSSRELSAMFVIILLFFACLLSNIQLIVNVVDCEVCGYAGWLKWKALFMLRYFARFALIHWGYRVNSIEIT